MIRISSASTLFFAIFLPVFWFVFFGSLTVGLFIISSEEMDYGFMKYLKWIFLFLFLVFFLIIYRTIWRLRRVDADQDYIYVTNYIKTIRIPYAQIESLTSKSLSWRLLARLKLKHNGYFGSEILFLCEEEKYQTLEQFLRN